MTRGCSGCARSRRAAKLHILSSWAIRRQEQLFPDNCRRRCNHRYTRLSNGRGLPPKQVAETSRLCLRFGRSVLACRQVFIDGARRRLLIQPESYTEKIHLAVRPSRTVGTIESQPVCRHLFSLGLRSSGTSPGKSVNIKHPAAGGGLPEPRRLHRILKAVEGASL